jgi:hypothetical protein
LRVYPLSALHAGAGGVRSRAISVRISWNICRDCDLGNLKRDVASVADHVRAYLDQVFAQAGQRPRLAGLGIANVSMMLPRLYAST